MIMETTTIKQQAAFRLNKDLLTQLRIRAKKENRSLSNYVECILFDVVYREPNEETLAAMREAQEGKSAGALDMTDYDSFLKSLNEIE